MIHVTPGYRPGTLLTKLLWRVKVGSKMRVFKAEVPKTRGSRASKPTDQSKDQQTNRPTNRHYHSLSRSDVTRNDRAGSSPVKTRYRR